MMPRVARTESRNPKSVASAGVCQQQPDRRPRTAGSARGRPGQRRAPHSPIAPIRAARSTLASGPDHQHEQSQPGQGERGGRRARGSRRLRAASSRAPRTRLQLAPLTAVRWVMPTVFMAAASSGSSAPVSPVTIPGRSPRASPGNPAAAVAEACAAGLPGARSQPPAVCQPVRGGGSRQYAGFGFACSGRLAACRWRASAGPGSACPTPPPPRTSSFAPASTRMPSKTHNAQGRGHRPTVGKPRAARRGEPPRRRRRPPAPPPLTHRSATASATARLVPLRGRDRGVRAGGAREQQARPPGWPGSFGGAGRPAPAHRTQQQGRRAQPPSPAHRARKRGRVQPGAGHGRAPTPAARQARAGRRYRRRRPCAPDGSRLAAPRRRAGLMPQRTRCSRPPRAVLPAPRPAGGSKLLPAPGRAPDGPRRGPAA